MVHPQAGDLLEEAQNFLAFTPPVNHHRHRAKIHAVGRHKQQVAAHPVELGEQHPDPHGSVGDFAIDSEQLLGCHRKDEFVGERTQVVHSGDVRTALGKRELLAGLFHPCMQITDDRLTPQNSFALQFEHQPEHTMC